MAEKNKKFYISTAIPYINAPPHIGFALEIVQADVLARYHRLLEEDVFFLTGTDENSLKNVQAAKEEGIATDEFVARNAELYRDLREVLNLSWDDFIRTTEPRHLEGAQKLWEACKKEDIYKKEYEGLYCVGCEEFYKESELEDGFCPEHKTKLENVSEENYFFRLSGYQKELEELISSDTLRIIPESRKNEALSFIRGGLEDFSISRSNERAQNWGVPVPGDDSQRMYVWIDALSNYINALGYGDDAESFKRYWQENDSVLHCIGKGIIRFHVVYWPAILLSARVALPKTIFIHGYLTAEGQKMSKSLGNVVSPKDIVREYGVDPTRYYLLREISSVEDGDFGIKKFEARYESDLANGLGNLVSRVLSLAEKSLLEGVSEKNDLEESIKKSVKDYEKALGDFKFNEGLEAIWSLIGVCDQYVNKERPWEKNERNAQVLWNLVRALGHIGWMLKPYLPDTSEKIFEQLGIDPENGKSWGKQKFTIKKGEALFPRLDKASL